MNLRQSLNQRLSQCRAAPPSSTTPPTPRHCPTHLAHAATHDADDDATSEVPDEAAPGCGWFDSSRELRAGLQVTEHLSPERVADAVPLGWWLAWQAQTGARSMPALCR